MVTFPTNSLTENGEAEMRRFPVIACIVGLCLVPGCMGRGHTDLLEARLRHQEDRLRQMQREADKSDAELAAARRETDLLRSQLTQDGTGILLAEQSELLARATGIRVNTLLSGGIDRDGAKGHEGVSVVLIPHDQQGDPVKLIGTASLELSEMRDGTPYSLGTWSFPPKELRLHWNSGLFGAGYQFDLDWQVVPQSTALVLDAQLSTADGRQFETSAEVTVDPPARDVTSVSSLTAH